VRGYVEKGEGEGQARSIKLLKFDGKKITTSSDEEKTGADKGKLVPTTIGEVMSDFFG
jgi:DNA topoisomerase-1